MSSPASLDEAVGFDRLCGIQIVASSPEEVHLRVEVTEDHKQPFGLVHGGLYATMAETAASIGTFLGVKDEGKAAMGLSNQTSFLRPVFGGTVDAVARRRHKGRTTWLWEVDVTDADGRLCAVVRMTIAVRAVERA
jgi:1,4-dihydroxy-2-naphthoyl-CoA hydrolase